MQRTLLEGCRWSSKSKSDRGWWGCGLLTYRGSSPLPRQPWITNSVLPKTKTRDDDDELRQWKHCPGCRIGRQKISCSSNNTTSSKNAKRCISRSASGGALRCLPVGRAQFRRFVLGGGRRNQQTSKAVPGQCARSWNLSSPRTYHMPHPAWATPRLARLAQWLPVSLVIIKPPLMKTKTTA
jgi:hypothetical protein